MQTECDATSGTKCDGRFDNLQCIRQLPMYGQSVVGKIGYTAFPESPRKLITNFHQDLTKECYPMTSKTRQKGMRKPKYNCKFTGCMQSKRKLSMEMNTISNNNQQSLRPSNDNIESLCVVKERSQKKFHSNANLHAIMQQYTLMHVTAPATADNGTSVTSARVHARHAFPTMSTCSFPQQRGMSLSSPTTAHPAEIEWDVAATNAL